MTIKTLTAAPQYSTEAAQISTRRAMWAAMPLTAWEALGVSWADIQQLTEFNPYPSIIEAWIKCRIEVAGENVRAELIYSQVGNNEGFFLSAGQGLDTFADLDMGGDILTQIVTIGATAYAIDKGITL